MYREQERGRKGDKISTAIKTEWERRLLNGLISLPTLCNTSEVYTHKILGIQLEIEPCFSVEVILSIVKAAVGSISHRVDAHTLVTAPDNYRFFQHRRRTY